MYDLHEWNRGAVVLTTLEGIHCFSYTGPPSGSGRFWPHGNLACDEYTYRVQILRHDGQFVKHLLTEESPGYTKDQPVSSLSWIRKLDERQFVCEQTDNQRPFDNG